MRYYNCATGRCDLTEDQADDQERRRETYDQACEEESERRRKERLEMWKNTPVDPGAKDALGDVPPEVAWEHILGLVWQASEYQCEASYALLHEMNMNEDLRTMLAIRDQEDLILYLSRMNPVEGVNEFVHINENVAFENIQSQQPLEVLKGVLRILTASDRWASRF